MEKKLAAMPHSLVFLGIEYFIPKREHDTLHKEKILTIFANQSMSTVISRCQ